MAILKPKRVLVTGHRGYIGSVLVEKLKNIGHSVSLFFGDVSDSQSWVDQIPNVDVIFHLAAVEYNSSKSPFQDLNVNAVSTLRMLEACRELSVQPAVIFASSSNIFSKAIMLPVIEEHKDSPASIWSSHKLLSENYLSAYARELEISATSLRLSNVYGPSTSLELTRRMPLNKMIESALNNHELTLYENKDCIRDWAYIDDVVDAFVAAVDIQEIGHSSYLIGFGSNMTIAEYANNISACVELATSKNVNIVRNFSKLSEMAMRNYTPDCEKFKNKTGWSAKVNLIDGIMKTMECINGY